MASIPLIIEAISKSKGIRDDDETLNDKASGIYGTFISIGAIIAPILGGALSEWVGYRYTNDIMALACAVMLLMYVFTNTKPEYYKCFKKGEKRELYNSEIERSIKNINATTISRT